MGWFPGRGPNFCKIQEKICRIAGEHCALETTRPGHLGCHHVPPLYGGDTSTKGLCWCQYYPQCQFRCAVSLLLMPGDRSPTVRTPLCFWSGSQMDSSAAGGDLISVSAIRSHPLRLSLCVCVGGRQRECTVPSDCWEHMCWRQPECVLKWRLMNKRPESCVWMRPEGQQTCVKDCTNLSLCLPTVRACAGW